jgi:hypothetical protein
VLLEVFEGHDGDAGLVELDGDEEVGHAHAAAHAAAGFVGEGVEGHEALAGGAVLDHGLARFEQVLEGESLADAAVDHARLLRWHQSHVESIPEVKLKTKDNVEYLFNIVEGIG